MVDDPDVSRWKMAKAGIVGDRFEEDMVSQALERQGIPFLIRRYSDTAYDGLFIPQKGWAAVMVPKEYVERAKAVLGNLKKDFKLEDTETKNQKPEDGSQESESDS
jgi:hypothetical protein